MRKRFPSHFVVVVIALGVAFPRFVFAGDESAVDVQPVKDAIALLGRFPAAANATLATISNTPVGGQRTVAYKCGYDCLGSLCFMDLSFQSSANFDGAQNLLRSKVQEVKNSTQGFSGTFTPMLKAWANTALPNSSAAFGQAADTIRAVQQEVAKGSGPSASQRLTVLTALERLVGSLNASRSGLTTMSQVLGPYLQQQRIAQGSLASWGPMVRGQVESTAKTIRSQMDAQRCQGDGHEQLNRIVAQMNTSIGTVTQSTGELDRLTTDADRALSVVLGTFVSFASRYEEIATQLKNAKDAPAGSVIQNIHFSVAQQSWQEFVDAANKSGF